MPRARGRASQATLDSLHREVAKSLLSEFKRIRKAKEPVSAALLTAATSLLKATGTVQPELPRNRPDRLAGLLQEFNDDEGGADRGVPDFTLPQDRPARSFPDEG
jgi:hypothetical protein